MAPVNMTHGELATEIGSALRSFVRPRKLGKVFVETGFRLQEDPSTVLAPDVSFLEAVRVPSRRRGFVPGPPTLAVEVTSPDDSDRDVADKVQEYLAFGTGRVWVVRPELRTITVHRPDGSAQTYRGDAALSSDDAGFGAEGFALAVEELFSAVD